MSSEAPPDACANCGAVSTSHCSRCKEAKYCSVECQRADWPVHKPSCVRSGTDLVVHRAAQLLQDVFLLLREKTFGDNIESIHDLGDALVIRDNPTTYGTLHPFPHHLVHNEEQRKMVLTTFTCHQSIAFLHDLTLKLLEGTDVGVEELSVNLKPPSRKVRMIYPDGEVDDENLDHAVIRARASNGRTWIIDLSGPQYNILKPCFDEKTYGKRYVNSIVQVTRAGTNTAIWKKLASGRSGNALVARISWAAVDKIHGAISSWKAASGQDLPGLMRSSDPVFAKERKAVLGLIETALAEFVANMDIDADRERTQFHEATNPLASMLDMEAALEEIMATNPFLV